MHGFEYNFHILVTHISQVISSSYDFLFPFWSCYNPWVWQHFSMSKWQSIFNMLCPFKWYL